MVRMDWTSYLMSGILAIVLSWAVSGCKFGNKVTPATSPDPYVGYYELRPQSLTLFVKLEPELSAREALSAPTNVPSPIGNFLSNPTFVFSDNGFIFLTHYIFENRVDAIPALIQSDLSLTSNGSGGQFMAWDTADCVRQFHFQGSGLMDQTTGRLLGAINTRGHIELDIRYYNTFTGTNSFSDCSASMTAISECLDDHNHCLGNSTSEQLQEQEFFQSLFNIYTDAGIIDRTDIPNVEAMGYEVSYQ